MTSDDRLATSRVLLERVRDGSTGALDTLLAQVAGKLLARIRLRMGPSLRRHQESRDILQATLLKAVRSIDQLRAADNTTLLAWLSRIAENELRDRAAHHGRQRRDADRESPLDTAAGSDPALVAQITSATERLVRNERLDQLETALETLPEAQREVIVLRKLDELPWSVVAERVGTTADAARMRYARAMAALTMRMDGTSTGTRVP